MRSTLQRLKQWAYAIRREAHTVYLVARDRRTPWYARALATAIAAYALSPIDLIPDFIPVLGLLDEVVLLPLLMLLVIRVTPLAIVAEARAAAALAAERPASRAGAAMIVLLWVAAAGAAVFLVWPTGEAS